MRGGSRSSIGGGSSSTSLSSYHRNSFVRDRSTRRKKPPTSYSQARNTSTDCMFRNSQSFHRSPFETGREDGLSIDKTTMMIPNSSASDTSYCLPSQHKIMDDNSNCNNDSSYSCYCMPSPTVTASTTPMNTPPTGSSSSFYSANSFGYNSSQNCYSSQPPSSLSYPDSNKMSTRDASRRSNGGGFLPRPTNVGDGEWGQFVDVAHAEEELERHSQLLPLSSRQRYHVSIKR